MKGCILNDDGCRTWDCDECPYYKEEDLMEDINKTMTDYEVIITTSQMLQGGFMRESEDDQDAAVVIGGIQRGEHHANMCYITGEPAEVFMILDMIIERLSDNLGWSFDQILELIQDGHHGYSGRNADNK